jgi:SpoVK/Ycf46/Vps4 family AAA+-type ATPase
LLGLVASFAFAFSGSDWRCKVFCLSIVVLWHNAQVREELAMSIIEPIAKPERFTQLGLAIPAGVLLFGPPGR